MARRVCLSIGVSTVTPSPNQAMRFAYLDGAVFAARAIGEWALGAGFGVENVRIVDDGDVGGSSVPVTCERVQQAVDELFPAGAEVVAHMLLAFCGHGLTDANVGAISWLFSDSLRMKYRVVADLFYTELLLHGVERITLITDACREAPKGLDLMRLDPDRGIVVQGTQVDSPRFDRFAACQDGQLGYMVAGSSSAAPGKCVFSGVIADALWGIEPAAIVNGVITTATLGACVRSRTAERAQEYRLKLNPQCLVDPEPAVLYNMAAPPQPPAGLQPWPPVGAAAVLGAAEAAGPIDDVEQNFARVHSDPDFRDLILGTGFGSGWHDLAAPADRLPTIPGHSKDLLQELVALRQPSTRIPEKKQKVRALVKRIEADAAVNVRQLAAGEVRRRLEQVKDLGDANLLVWGDQASLLSYGLSKRLDATPPFLKFRVKGDPYGMPVLVELLDGTFTPVVPYENLYTVVTPSAAGDVFQVYGQDDFRDSYLAAISAISDFAAGRLRADGIDLLAGRLRHEKHADPALGAICAHLYRAIADYDSIRRMAYFYFAHGQPVPFDIALLGAMQVTREANGALLLHVPAVKARKLRPGEPDLPYFVTQATPAVQAWIGGRCPWLGMGWDYVKEPRPEWAALVDGLAAHAKKISRRGSTVLPKIIGRTLAAAWNLKTQ